jgi:lipopolysaccharide/colanic/teichoic acid biosynthesis glycosyltransferase
MLHEMSIAYSFWCRGFSCFPELYENSAHATVLSPLAPRVAGGGPEQTSWMPLDAFRRLYRKQSVGFDLILILCSPGQAARFAGKQQAGKQLMRNFFAALFLLPLGGSGALAQNLIVGENQRNHPVSVAGKSAAAASTADFARVPLWKRVLDICCLLIAVPTLLPMLLIIAIAIKVGSKGPVLFKQERVGVLGKRFIIFKFRTMIAGADTAVHETHAASLIESNRPMTKLDAHGDERLIPFGRMLRVAGLDELPQLINVLRGDMSFVGPRPCLPSEYNRYLPWQRERFLTLPGLTGLWQVSGKNRTTFKEMIDLDIQYVRMPSLWLDLKIILKTIPAVMVEVRDILSPATPTTSSHSTDQTPRD